MAAHDIALVRVCRRDALLGLTRDRRFGYPVERSSAPPTRGWRWSSATCPTTRAPRAPAPRCPVRSAAPPARGTRLLAGAGDPPVGRPGTGGRQGRSRAIKTRLGAEVGDAVAPRSPPRRPDTVAACREAFGADHCLLALAGDLADAARGDEIAGALSLAGA